MEFDNLARSIGIDVDAVAKRAGQMGLAFNEGQFAAMSFMDKLKYLATITGGLHDMYNQAQMDQLMQKAATMDDVQAEQYLAEAFAHSNSQLKSLVGGAAAFIPAMILLSGHGQAYADILKQMGTNGEATNRAFNIMRESTGQQWKMMLLSMQNVLVVLGLQLLPAVNVFLTSLRGVGIALSSWLSMPGHFEALASAIKGIAIVAGAILLPVILSLVTAIAPFLLALGAIVAAGILVGKAFDAISDHIRDLSMWFESLFGTTQKVVMPFKELQTVFYTVNGHTHHMTEEVSGVRTAFVQVQGPLSGVRDVFVDLGRAAKSVVDWFTPIPSHVQKVTTSLGQMKNSTDEGVQKLQQMHGSLQAIHTAFITIPGRASGFQQFLHGIGNAFAELGKYMEPVLRTLRSEFSMVSAQISTTLNTQLKPAIADLMKSFHLMEPQLKILAQVLGGVLVLAIAVSIGALNGLIMAVGFILAGFIRFVGGVIRVWSGFAMIFSAITRVLGDVLTLNFTDLQKNGTKIWNQLKDGLLAITSGLLDALMGLWESTIGSVLAGIWGFVTGAIGFFQRLYDALVGHSIVVDLVNTIDSLFTNLAVNAANWGTNLVNNFVKGIMSKWNDLTNTLGNIKDAINNKFQGHSPPPGWPEMATWGPNMMNVLSQGILANIPQLTMALGQVQVATNTAMFGSPQTTTLVAGIGGGTSYGDTHIHLSFPGVDSADEVEKIAESYANKRERTNYMKGRRGGHYQGLRSGI